MLLIFSLENIVELLAAVFALILEQQKKSLSDSKFGVIFTELTTILDWQ